MPITPWQPTIRQDRQVGHEVFYFAITDEMRRAGLFGPYLDFVGPYTDAQIATTQAAQCQAQAVAILEGGSHRDQ